MNKLYEKIVTKGKVYEKFNFGTNISSPSIIPQNVLINQTNEINRLNAIIDKLEKALDKACEKLVSDERFMVLVPIDEWQSKYRELTKDEWKEWLLEDDKNEIY